jgi:putative transcriptional regulator
MRNRIAELRAAFGWTQAELADQLGVSRQTVVSIEKGKYDPSLPLAFGISRVFSEPIESIFTP